jgi:hypothetical protein
MLTSHYDALAILQSPRDRQNFEYLLKIDPNWAPFQDMITYHGSKLAGIVGNNLTGLSTGKLSFLAEPGGKTRVIAIGDYWSQIALRPLHDTIMKMLKRLETDGT